VASLFSNPKQKSPLPCTLIHQISSSFQSKTAQAVHGQNQQTQTKNPKFPPSTSSTKNLQKKRRGQKRRKIKPSITPPL
jgi:hypothetical protein